MQLEPTEVRDEFDVVVAGCGMAGMSAGLSAAENGAAVVVLEKAPKEHLGGQTQFAHAIRVPSTDTDIPGYEFEKEYSKSDLYQDIMKVTKGRADQELLETLVDAAGSTVEWLAAQGVEFEERSPMGRPSKNAIAWHPGYEGSNTLEILIDVATEQYDAEVMYNMEARSLRRSDESRITGVTVVGEDDVVLFACDAVVIAAGGFEANAEKRTRYMGPQFDEMKVRGSRYVTGEAMDMAIDIGANPVGQWSGAHMTMVDPALPDIEGGLMKINGFPYSVLVNHDGERFVDEGADMQSNTYAAYGRRAFEQPDHEVFLIFDEKTRDLVFSSGPSEPMESDSLETLVRRLGIDDVESTLETIEEFNAACDPGEFDPHDLDGNATTGIEPPKSNWALPIDEPPYYGFPTTGGITFTFGGLQINAEAQVLDTGFDPIPGLYAAGNSTGELFYYNYPGGSGQINAAVYGRIAGKNAAAYVTNR